MCKMRRKIGISRFAFWVKRDSEREERAFKVKVNERVNAGKYLSLDQVRGEFPRLSIRGFRTGPRMLRKI